MSSLVLQPEQIWAIKSARKWSALIRLKAPQNAWKRPKAPRIAWKYFEALKNEALSSAFERFQAFQSALKRFKANWIFRSAIHSQNKYWLHIARLSFPFLKLVRILKKKTITSYFCFNTLTIRFSFTFASINAENGTVSDKTSTIHE